MPVRDVVYHADGVSLRSQVVSPADSRGARRGGVVLFPEWWGVDEYAIGRARELAAAGYTVLVADMYGDGRSTRDAETAATPAARTRTGPSARARAAALGALTAETGFDPERLAAIGFCFGGSFALELARAGAPLAAAVALHASLAAPEPAAPGVITASVLVLHGANDPHVPAEQVFAFAEEMRSAGAQWELIAYGGAEHSFTRPDASASGIAGASHHERAARREWAATQTFLDELAGQLSVRCVEELHEAGVDVVVVGRRQAVPRSWQHDQLGVGHQLGDPSTGVLERRRRVGVAVQDQCRDVEVAQLVAEIDAVALHRRQQHVQRRVDDLARDPVHHAGRDRRLAEERRCVVGAAARHVALECLGVGRQLLSRERRRGVRHDRGQERSSGDPTGRPRREAHDLAASIGVADHRCGLELQVVEQRVEILGAGVEVVAGPWAVRTAVPAAVQGDDEVTGCDQVRNLVLPGASVQCPGMAQHHRRPVADVAVVELHPVSCLEVRRGPITPCRGARDDYLPPHGPGLPLHRKTWSCLDGQELP